MNYEFATNSPFVTSCGKRAIFFAILVDFLTIILNNSKEKLMIKDIKTTINRLGKIKVEIVFEERDLETLQARLDKLVEFINNELEQEFTTNQVNFYDESQAVEDLKKIFKSDK